MSEFKTLRAANEARQIEWDKDNSISLAYRGNELAGEVGEACNVIKKLERERMGIRGSRATIGQLAEELADCLICLDLIAMQAGIDLDVAMCAKFNNTSTKYDLATRLADPQTPAQMSRTAALLKFVKWFERYDYVWEAEFRETAPFFDLQEAYDRAREALA